jgi:hypothetical protein
LQSGFDGAELLARPGIELVTVDPTTIRKTESKIDGCERCRNDESDIPFNFVIADVLEKHGAFDFIMSEPAHCPNCRAELSEKTLVELQGGIEVGLLSVPNDVVLFVFLSLNTLGYEPPQGFRYWNGTFPLCRPSVSCLSKNLSVYFSSSSG